MSALVLCEIITDKSCSCHLPLTTLSTHSTIGFLK
jgi:hypothetical protein